MIIPNKDLFIVTSALKTSIGVIDDEARLRQTVDGLQSLRKYAPGAIILFVDASSRPVDEATMMLLSKYCDRSINFYGDEDLMTLANAGLKSQAEITLLFKTLNIIKQHPELQKMMAGVRRVFKFSGRTNMLEGYDPKEYDDLYGKYVFKKSMPSWMDENRKRDITDHLYITRFYSMCPSLLDNYLDRLQSILQNIQQHGIDTEHAHYLCLDRKDVVEFDTIGVEGIMGGTGQREIY